MKKLVSIILVMVAGFATNSCGNEEAEISRDVFLGIYKVQESCDSGDYSYNIEITASTKGPNALIIDNLYDWWELASATVSGNRLDIPSQELDELVFEGNGTLTGDILTIHLTVSYGLESDKCTLTCTKM